MNDANRFREARQFLLEHRESYDHAIREFRWPQLEHFNWALDWFDAYAANNSRTALWIVDEDGGETKLSFAELSTRSNRVANFLRSRGAKRGERILLMLPNVAQIWEAMLAAMKLGLVIVPATTQLTVADLQDRFERGRIRHVVTDATGAAKLDGIAADFSKLIVGAWANGWTPFEEAYEATAQFVPDAPTRATDPLLLYFTSGTTAKPKLVLHTHESYPVGHLSTMYWLGLREDDVHLNISSPGWAKHAWSNVFAPWNAGCTVFVYNYKRFEPKKMLDTIVRCGVTTLCAPPTVWRMLVGEDLAKWPVKLREVAGAGEPLNPEVIERIQRAWNLTIRDGYGQTETTAQIANSPGQAVKSGSMGRPMPGYHIALLDADGKESDEGEISISLQPCPTGLMVGYLDDPARTAEVTRDGYYRTGDVARRDADSYITYVGRADDVFKSSDYRISPFELESILIEHPAIAEAAVVPSPDPVRLCVPKAFCVLRAGHQPNRALALELFQFVRARLAPFKRIRRIEFCDLPKTISGKIRRVELRALEEKRISTGERGAHEFWEQDLLELRSPATKGE